MLDLTYGDLDAFWRCGHCHERGGSAALGSVGPCATLRWRRLHFFVEESSRDLLTIPQATLLLDYTSKLSDNNLLLFRG
jgi:hypothetical protein